MHTGFVIHVMKKDKKHVGFCWRKGGVECPR